MDLNLIRIILVPLFVCIGTVGNILSLITVANKHCKKSSYAVYLAGLAIADLLTLYTCIIKIWLPQAFGINLATTNAIYCKLHVPLLGIFSGVSIWLVVILALERTFCMYFPFKMKSVCTPKIALITTTLLVTFFIAYTLHYIYGMQLKSGISRNGDPVLSSPEMSTSINLGKNENETLPTFTEAFPGCLKTNHNSNHANNSTTTDKFLGSFARKEIKANKSVEMELESDNGAHRLLAVPCNWTETKSDNYTVSLAACPSAEMKSINQTGQPPVGDCKPANWNSGNLSDEPCTLNGSLVTQSPDDNCDSSPGFDETKTRALPTELTDGICGFLDQNYVDFYRFWAWFEGLWYFWFPVVILVTANTATWIKVYRSSRGGMTAMSALLLRRTRHVMILTSLISVGFIVFVTPITVLFFVEAEVEDDIVYLLYNEKDRAVLELIAECLYLCNHSFNFFLYILSGQRFRNSLKAAFCKSTPRQGTPGIQYELQPKPNLVD